MLGDALAQFDPNKMPSYVVFKDNVYLVNSANEKSDKQQAVILPMIQKYSKSIQQQLSKAGVSLVCNSTFIATETMRWIVTITNIDDPHSFPVSHYSEDDDKGYEVRKALRDRHVKLVRLLNALYVRIIYDNGNFLDEAMKASVQRILQWPKFMQEPAFAIEPIRETSYDPYNRVHTYISTSKGIQSDIKKKLTVSYFRQLEDSTIIVLDGKIYEVSETQKTSSKNTMSLQISIKNKFEQNALEHGRFRLYRALRYTEVYVRQVCEYDEDRFSHKELINGVDEELIEKAIDNYRIAKMFPKFVIVEEWFYKIYEKHVDNSESVSFEKVPGISRSSLYYSKNADIKKGMRSSFYFKLSKIYPLTAQNTTHSMIFDITDVNNNLKLPRILDFDESMRRSITESIMKAIDDIESFVQYLFINIILFQQLSNLNSPVCITCKCYLSFCTVHNYKNDFQQAKCRCSREF